MTKLTWPKILARTAVALLIATPAAALAEGSYPDRPIKIVVPTAPGSAPDLLPRLVGEKLTAKWAQPIIIENRPGATGNVGAEAVAKANPDGYTLLATFAAPLSTNQTLYSKLNFTPEAFVPVTGLPSVRNVRIRRPCLQAPRRE